MFLVATYFYAATRNRRDVQVMCAVAACLTYALNVLYLPLAVLMPLLARRRPTRADIFFPAIVSAMGAGWLMSCAGQQKQVSWIHTSPSADVMASFIRVGVSSPTSRTAEHFVTVVSVMLGGVLVAIGSYMLLRHETRKEAALLFALWVFPPLAASFAVLAGKDIFVERYFTPSVIGMALMVGYCSSRVRLEPAARYGFGAGVLALCIPPFISSHAADGHWGENLNIHQREVRAAGPHGTAFVAPRNRAVLFASGRLEERWRDAAWWRKAQENGQLWGPGAPAPQGTRVVVVDTRVAHTLTALNQCILNQRRTIHREARFTTLYARCAQGDQRKHATGTLEVASPFTNGQNRTAVRRHLPAGVTSRDVAPAGRSEEELP